MKHGKTPGSFHDAGAKALRANFRKIEHREWWLWAAAAIITRLLTFALASFLPPNPAMPQDFHSTAIVEQVWKLNFDTTTNVVDVYINYLRRKVDSGYDRALIRTIRGWATRLR